VRIKRRIATAVLVVAAAALAIAATTASADSDSSQHAGAAGAQKAAAGGVYRTEWQGSFDFTGGFDPTGEYLASAWGIYSNLLVRTLVTYNHVAGSAGNVVVPDIATDLGKVTNNGKTYTFKLKSGVKFGPPLNRAITSKDILYAFQRIGTPSVVAQYAFYYDVIKGMKAFESGKSKVIQGIKTPDNNTIIFDLTEPTGDFRNRLAMPATGPMPQDVAGCFTQPLQYGRYVISTGPYMIAGSDKLNAASCDTIKAAGGISGFDGTTKLDLVRNPAYDPKTDSAKDRENLPDEFTFTVNSNVDDIFAKIDRGDIEDAISGGTVPAAMLRQYKGSNQLKINAGDRTNYFMMNLSTPPFDDVHVRRAVNWVVDKEAIRKAWGGPVTGLIATHIAPDPILNNKLKGYAPYGTGKGDVAKAKAEMKLSKYDKNHDGICDGPVCKVFTITGDRAPEKAFVPSLEQNMKSIGLLLNDRVLKDAYTPISIPKQNVPFSTRPGWGKDYADPYTFFTPNFASNAITPSGNANRGLVGITPAQAKKLGVKGSVAGIPSVDKDLARCKVTAEAARYACYSALDKKMMTDVVPWVPWMWTNYINLVSKNVTQWNFDQFGTITAFAHVAVK
jgi:peptide/nickel transport system substrate-binding protein